MSTRWRRCGFTPCGHFPPGGGGGGTGATKRAGRTAGGLHSVRFRRSWARCLARLRGRHPPRRALNRTDGRSRDPCFFSPLTSFHRPRRSQADRPTEAPRHSRSRLGPAERLPTPPSRSLGRRAAPPPPRAAPFVWGAELPPLRRQRARCTPLPLTSGGPQGGGTRPPEESSTTAPRRRGPPAPPPGGPPHAPAPPQRGRAERQAPHPKHRACATRLPPSPPPPALYSLPTRARAAPRGCRPGIPAARAAPSFCHVSRRGTYPAESCTSGREEPGAAGAAPQHVARLGRQAPSRPARPHRVGAGDVPPSPADWRPGEPMERRVREASGGVGGRLPMRKERGRGRA